MDLRYALRGLAREPVFAGFAIVTLALGIGANAAMFGVLDRLLLRGPAHVVEPGRVVRLFWHMRQPDGSEGTTAQGFDRPLYPNLVAESRVFSALALYAGAIPSLFGDGDAARLVPRAGVSATFFPALGVRPHLGRFFTTEEQEASPPARVVVLGYGLWRSDFGGDPNVVGKPVRLGLTQYTVIGVAPPRFTGVERDRVDLWTPTSVPTGPAARKWQRGHSYGWYLLGRLKPEVTFEQANADATGAHRRTYDADEPNYANARISVGALSHDNTGKVSTETTISRWLVGLSAIVLLVACANIVNLLLARAVRRRREMAVRLALGAGRARLMRLLLTESGLVALLGGVAGLVVAAGAGRLVQQTLAPTMDWSGGVVDGRVLAFTLVTTALTGLLIGIAPALRAGRADVAAALKAGVREGGGHRSTVRGALMMAQAALAMVLLAGAGLFVRSFQRVRSADLGVEASRVVTLSPRWQALPASPEERDREQRRREQFVAEALLNLRANRDVERAGITIGFPFGPAFSVTLRLPGVDSLPRLPGSPSADPNISKVSSDYFATIGTRLLRGRVFTEQDRAESMPVAVVNKTMAETLWPGRDAIGQCLLVGGGTPPPACTYVVGVVQDTRRREIREEPYMHYYLPIDQGTTSIGGTTIVVRPRGDATASIAPLRRAIRAMDASIWYVDAETLQERIDPQFRTWRVGAMMFSLFAALAVVVAAVGLFGVVAYLVEQRRHEIGVRMALGARAVSVVALVMRGATGVILVGVVIGSALALALGRVAQPLLYETQASDPKLLGGLAIVLIIVSLVASGLPALRALRVDALTALRED